MLAGAELRLSGALSSAPNLLFIEDEPDAASYISDRLVECGWRVDHCSDGEDGLRLALNGGFDVIVVDRMLPRLDGLALVEKLRAQGDDTPVLFVSAMGAVVDRLAGFKGGGDDYLVKPFSFEELDARLHALARRRRPTPETAVKVLVGELEINRIERSVRRGGETIELLPLEYKLLEYLALRAGQVVTRAMLLEDVWGFNFDPRTNIVETHISRLRAKITPPGAEPLIMTRRGAGYVAGAA